MSTGRLGAGDTAIQPTIVDAKGDLIVGVSADTVARLAAASTAGYLLTTDSSQSTGLKWAAPAVSVPYTNWTSYTPTWSQAGGSFSLGNGTSTGAYTRVGEFVYVRAKLVFGSTTTLNAAYMLVSVPSGLTNRLADGGIPLVGFSWYYDTSTAARAEGPVLQHNNSDVRLYYWKADTTNLSVAGFSGTAPWTVATGDEVWAWFIYPTDAA